MIRSPLTLALATVLALAACGKVGALEQPAPLYGAKAKAQYEAKKQAAAEAARARKDEGQIEHLAPDKTYDPNADPSPSRVLPIPGAHETPNGPPPPGSLPDPINSPPR